MPYRYRPKDNRTPVNHPVLGHLEWDTIVDSPLCAGLPDFEEIPSPDDLEAHTRNELHEIAAAAGVEEPHKLPNKHAVIAAIQERAATVDEPDGADDETQPPDTPEASDAGETGQESSP